MTNYEKIKGMGMDEMAWFFEDVLSLEDGKDIVYCRFLKECSEDVDQGRYIPKERCVGCMKLWLESEAGNEAD